MTLRHHGFILTPQIFGVLSRCGQKFRRKCPEVKEGFLTVFLQNRSDKLSGPLYLFVAAAADTTSFFVPWYSTYGTSTVTPGFYFSENATKTCASQARRQDPSNASHGLWIIVWHSHNFPSLLSFLETV
jgi:hypothetical protein